MPGWRRRARRARRGDASRGDAGAARQGRGRRRAARPGHVSSQGRRGRATRVAHLLPRDPGPERGRSVPLGARLGLAPAPLQPRAGEAQGASAKSEELNNELGIRAGSVAPCTRTCDPRAGSAPWPGPLCSSACAEMRLRSVHTPTCPRLPTAARASYVTADITHSGTTHAHTRTHLALGGFGSTPGSGSGSD